MFWIVFGVAVSPGPRYTVHRLAIVVLEFPGALALGRRAVGRALAQRFFLDATEALRARRPALIRCRLSRDTDNVKRTTK